MRISDKLKGSVGLVLTVLLIGSIMGNYIESQKSGVTIVTYADIVGKNSDKTEETEQANTSIDTQSQATSASESESVPADTQSQATSASESQSAAPVTQAVTTATVAAVSSAAEVYSAPQSYYDEAEQRVVYVSSTGKYHKKCDCSGMKNYTEMTLQQAVEAGYTACKRCW